MFSTASWKLPLRPEFLTLVTGVGLFAISAWAEPVRIGRYFHNFSGQTPTANAGVAQLVEQVGQESSIVAPLIHDCPTFVSAVLEKIRPADQLRDTWVLLQSYRVQCWALLQLDQNAALSDVLVADQVEAGMIRAIMGYVHQKRSASEDWSKTFADFPGGEISCKNAQRCTLSWPDGKNPPEQSVGFDLILATGDDVFISAHQMVYGRSGFVYGVHWRTGGGVVAIFPDFE